MTGKFLSLGALLGGFTLFIWGFIWHAAVPLYDSVMYEFADPQAVNTVIQQNAAYGNGVYYTVEGAFVAVAFAPDMHNKEDDMGTTVPIEFIANMLTAFLFAIIIGKTVAFGSPLRGALFMGLLGLTAEISVEASYWNWYGFSASFTAMNIVHDTLGWFIAGFVISALYFKLEK